MGIGQIPKQINFEKEVLCILKQFADAGAIKNVDYDNDFLVDREKSVGDETYFNVGLEAVDSAEKLYFTVATR